MRNFRLKIFCDFDGTITKNDVWLNSLARFIDDKQELGRITEQFVTGLIDSRTTSELHMKLIRNFSEERFREYLSEEEIDPSFSDFAGYCRSKSYPLFVLSSGLDFYIKEILNRNGIDLPFYGNTMISKADGHLSFKAIYSDEYCKECAVCKRNILISNTDELNNELSVYIGDGASDYCVSRYADIVFAKHRLASYCWKNNITYYEFGSFSDVSKKLDRLKESGKFRRRQEASVRRKDVLLGG